MLGYLHGPLGGTEGHYWGLYSTGGHRGSLLGAIQYGRGYTVREGLYSTGGAIQYWGYLLTGLGNLEPRVD